MNQQPNAVDDTAHTLRRVRRWRALTQVAAVLCGAAAIGVGNFPSVFGSSSFRVVGGIIALLVASVLLGVCLILRQQALERELSAQELDLGGRNVALSETNMKESAWGFEYTWDDLQPVRALAVTVIAGQLAGGLLGVLLPQFSRWFESLWFGAALATFPAFVAGVVIQAYLRPGSIGASKVMVRRLGIIAFLLTAFALAMPMLGFGDAP
jgi:hypothetical protein